MYSKKGNSLSEDEPGPSKKVKKIDMRGEPAKRKKIEKKYQDIKKLTDLQDKLIQQYEQKYGPYVPRVVTQDNEKQTELSKIDSFTSYSDVYRKRDVHERVMNEAKLKNRKACRICYHPVATYFGNICGPCNKIKRKFQLLPVDRTTEEGHDEEEEEEEEEDEGQQDVGKNEKPLIKIADCKGVKQLLGQCKPDWQLKDCTRDKLVKIKSKFPEYETRLPIPDVSPPPCTEIGQYGYFMDLSKVNKTMYNFDLFPTERQGIFDQRPASLIVRCMDFATTDKRLLCTLLIRFDLDDPKLDSAYGLQQLVHIRKPRNFLKTWFTNHRVDGSLVSVESDLIPWSDKNFEFAAKSATSHKGADFFLMPLLNKHQKFQTVVSNLTMESRYLDSERINFYLSKRGVPDLGWRKWSGKLTDNIMLMGPIEESSTDYVAIIYAHLTEAGALYLGHHNGLVPRRHDLSSTTSLANLKTANKEARSISTVLLYLKSNLDVYKFLMEGQVQMIYKIAELHDWTIGQLKFPFKINSENWPHFNLKQFQEEFKDVKIRMINDRIEARPVPVEDFLL